MNNLKRNVILLMAISTLFTGCIQTRLGSKSQHQDAESQSTGQENRTTANNTKNVASTSNYELEEIKNEMNRLTGKVDEIEHTQRTSNAADVRETLSKLESRVVELEKNQILIMTELKEMKDNSAMLSAANSMRATGGPGTAASKNLLQEANNALDSKEFEEAETKFKGYLAKKPKPTEAAEAQFGLGEALFGQKNYKKAIVEYSKVQEVNAKSSKIPSSLFKIGTCFQKLNMPKESKDFFAELQERYPNSVEAKKLRGKTKDK